MSWRWWRRIRRGVQWLALALYIYLLFAALQRRVAFPLADLFLRLDPLLAASSMLAARAWIPRLAVGLITVLVTLLLGRVWCGWICPLGTVLDLARARRAKPKQGGDRLAKARASVLRHDAAWRKVKYLLLVLLLVGALLSNLTLMVLDPITILTRTMTTAILPALNRAVTVVEGAMYGVRPLRGVVDVLERALRGPVLPVKQGVYYGSLLFAALFAGLLALNLVAHRFWCRYLCPLGGLLALLARFSLIRRRPARCTSCGACASTCDMEAIHPEQGYEADPAECTVCLDCLTACRPQRIAFRLQARPAPAQPYDPTRRQFLAALGASALGVTLLEGQASVALPHPRLIRPPGAQDERAFLQRCVRCSQCMKVCPTSGLQPCLDEAGWRGLGTPRLVPRLGHCDYSCHACGQVCPTGAITPLSLPLKRQESLGHAYIDTNRCLPWADGIPCIVCEEMCPVPDKAIRLIEETVRGEDGQEVVLQKPHVLRDLCIGCGICEYRCPLEGEAAIRVRRA